VFPSAKYDFPDVQQKKGARPGDDGRRLAPSVIGGIIGQSP
jgi:hypothetical protein